VAELTRRQQLGWGLALTTLSGGVLAHKLYRQASWGLDAIEVVVVLFPVGLYLTVSALRPRADEQEEEED